MKKKKIALFFGGPSAEHEISILTALQVLDALDPYLYEVHPVYIHQNGRWYTGEVLFQKETYKRWNPHQKGIEEITLLPHPYTEGLRFLSELHKSIKIDLCLLACHGQVGEDGRLQALLEMAELPYTGFSFAASSLSMDKYLCNRYLSSQQVPVLPQYTLSRTACTASFSSAVEEILASLSFSFPVIVKPRHLGSSIGISSCFDRSSFEQAIAKALTLDNSLIVEPFLQKMIEINVAVLDGATPQASVVEVPIPSQEGNVLSFEDKYLRGQKGQAEGMASMTRLIDPDSLPLSLKQQVQKLAIRIFQLLEAKGLARLDFLYDLENEKLYFNEINPIPGSFAYYLWEKSNPRLLFCDLLDTLIEKALIAHKERLRLKSAMRPTLFNK
jgi:D-alanine-D-alanine ligase